MEKEQTQVRYKYRISYRIGVNDQIHLDTISHVKGEAPLQLKLPFANDIENILYVQIIVGDMGIGVMVPREIYPGLLWKLKVSSVDIFLPTDDWIIIGHPVLRMRLTQLPLAQTGIQLMIEAS